MIKTYNAIINTCDRSIDYINSLYNEIQHEDVVDFSFFKENEIYINEEKFKIFIKLSSI